MTAVHPADVIRGFVMMYGDESVAEDDHPHYRGGKQPSSIKAEPGEVKTDLLAKVFLWAKFSVISAYDSKIS